jgi:hypothetical protein
MGVKGGPNIPNWETFDTMLDPSSIVSYSGTGFTFTNPLRLTGGFSDWTMGEATTNMIAGSGISKYVKQTSVQQYTQKIVQVGNQSSNLFTFIFIYRQPQAADYRTIIQWQSNDLGFYVEANGNITMKSSNTNYTTSGLAMTDDSWRHYAFTRSGTAATMYINGSLFTTFSGLSANNNSAGDTKMFDVPGCDGAVGLLWFKFGEADSATVVKRHYEALKGRFGIT